ncbi:BTAD domain-containing putative transcriptional regulator [Kribbella albertanoniae]|uniref:AfsR/SARP family transcriptional regulator n=1 Tax=Kribbella albertanoniae TaxID=1266829 RepID=A0A4R4PVR3_9ACTN|nr:AfsR/SARP family transcriptional regulator [Kribbella albertanoniae]TDC26514.1 AfsR/SARP family transcriptional regulator [Kribbella albertanoniae]
MEYRLLGPVQIWSGGDQVSLKRRQERLLLAVLLLEPGKAVAAQRLMELLWPDAMPTNPRRALQVYISRLRTLLDVELTSGREGYAIQAPAGSTDIEQYRTLVAQARQQDDLEQRSKLLTDALGLWRGPALADVTTEDVRQRLCGGLEEEHWAAEELLLTTELALGHHQELLPRLADLTAAQPTRETFAAASMLALYRSGRQADALAVYTSLVRRLDEELGVEPGAEVRDLQVAILRQDPSLDITVPSAAPRELPADVGLLIGRDDVLEELSAALLAPARAGVPAVVCLYGAAGTGKSAAAVRLGHRLADSFPDGQLFARLQDVNGQSHSPRMILGQLLRSLGVDGSELPESVEERSALLRSRLADKSVLLVFDDAIDAGQLRPLLPAGGAVIITSRRPMLGLEDATHRELLPLSDEISAELLGAVSGLGPARVAEVVPHCAGLPLALRIVGARLALIREDVAEVVQSLADESQRLDYLVAGDRAVRASLDLTLSTATAEARRLFACLALVGADEFAPWVAAPLLNLKEAAATAVLDNLVTLGLVQPRRLAPPRFGLHSLVRARTVELISEFDAGERAEAELRYVETVLRLVTAADDGIDHAMPISAVIEIGEERLLPGTLAAARIGSQWLDFEVPVIRAAVVLAAQIAPRIAGLLALRFKGFLAVRDLRETWIAVLQVARDATVASGDVSIEADLDRSLFVVRAQDSAPSDELAQLAERALRSAVRSGSVELRSSALQQVGWVSSLCADFGRALEVAEEMLALAESAPEARPMKIRALSSRGVALQFVNRNAEAQADLREAVTLDTPGTRIHAIRLAQLAKCLLDSPGLGAEHLPELYDVIGRAREIVERIGDDLGLAHVNNCEAMALIAERRLDDAERLLENAAAILIHHPDDLGTFGNAVGRARLAVAQGRPSDARDELGKALRRHSTDLAVHEVARQRELLGLAPVTG